MIDGIKSFDVKISAKNLEENELLEFKSELVERTGEILDKKVAKYNGLRFEITDDKKVKVLGSIHKLSNNGAHNHNDFNYNELVNTIIELHDKYDINPYKTFLNNLEFGVNIIPCIPVKTILDSIILFKKQKFNIKANGRIHYKECELQRYTIKIYDKGIQYGLSSNNILRIEEKVSKMIHLEKIGIKTLGDLLDITKLKMLGEQLISIFKDLLIYDYTIDLKLLTQRDRETLLAGQNPEFWLNIFETNRENYYKKRKRFEALVKMYGKNKIKDSLANLTSNKLNELLKADDKTIQKLTEFKTTIEKTNANKTLHKLIQGNVGINPKTIQKLTTKKAKKNTGFNTLDKGLKLIKNKINHKIKNRICLHCGADISHQKGYSKYCYDEHNNKFCRKQYWHLKNRIEGIFIKIDFEFRLFEHIKNMVLSDSILYGLLCSSKLTKSQKIRIIETSLLKFQC